MDLLRKRDLISSLNETFLILIISCLPYKDAVKTSVLSKCWRNLYLQTSNITFKESDFVNHSVPNDEVARREARVSFVQYMVTWVSRFSSGVIETLEICLSKPVGFEAQIRTVVEFAVPKGVKNLVLDFSDVSWVASNEARGGEASVFQLPDCVYSSTSIESLKLFFCGFDPSRFVNPRSLKSLCFGWIQLRNIMTLLWNCPLLDSLTMINCWNVGLSRITKDNHRLRELIYKNCEFICGFSMLDLPSIKIFKYSGTEHYFQFLAVNGIMKEVELDFEAETEYNNGTGNLLAGLLYDLSFAKKLTVSPFLLQVIQKSDDPVKIKFGMYTKHLVMKTNMQLSEFVGIRLLINSCPWLERLTFVMVPPRYVMPALPGVNRAYWSYDSYPPIHVCMAKTLKIVEVKNFRGSLYELQVIQYLIRNCLVLEKMDFYVVDGLDNNTMRTICAAADVLGTNTFRGSSRLRIFIHGA